MATLSGSSLVLLLACSLALEEELGFEEALGFEEDGGVESSKLLKGSSLTLCSATPLIPKKLCKRLVVARLAIATAYAIPTIIRAFFFITNYLLLSYGSS